MFDVTREELKALIDVALGRGKADLIVLNGRLVNVYSGEVQEGMTVAIKGRRIAYVGPDAAHAIGPQTERLDAAGAYLLPGLIDGHTHQAELIQLTEFVRVAAAHGTTAIITETNGLANAMGAPGVRAFLEECRHQPIKVFVTAPGMVPPFPHLEGSRRLDLDEFTMILDDARTLGMGESFWPRVLDADDEILERLRRCLNAGKEPEGHAAGARRERLQAFAAAGISSCHEPISREDALERLRLGMYVMMREGSIRRDLAGIAPIKDDPVDTRRLILVSDTTWPGELVAEGHMDRALRRAVALGFDPVRAVQMATLNVAEHFGLKHLGGIAPGKLADLLLVEDLQGFQVRLVLSDGRLLARDGRLLRELPRFAYPRAAYQSLGFPRVVPEDLRASAPGPIARIRGIRVLGTMLTGEEALELKVAEGVAMPDPDRDILKVVVVNRSERPLRAGLGFITGFGLQRGAVASSFNWEANNPVALGVSDGEIAFALDRVRALGGGAVVCADGRVLAEFPMPVAGVMSDATAEVAGRQIGEFQRAVRSLGSTLENPFLSLQTLSFTGLPWLRLTDRGLADIRRRELVSLLLEGTDPDG